MSLATFLENKRREQGMSKAQFCETIQNAAQEATGDASKKFFPTQLARILQNPNKVPSDSVLETLSLGLVISIDDLKKYCVDENKIEAVNCYELINASERVHEYNPEQPILKPLSIAEELCNHDDANFKPHQDYAGIPEQWGNIFGNNPELSKMLYFIDNSSGSDHIEIVGDVSIVVYPKGKVPIRDGTVRDSEITVGGLPHLSFLDGDCDMFILNMGFAGKYNSIKNGPLLLRTFLTMIDEFAEDKVFFDTLYVNVYARDISFYEGLGFLKYDKSRQNGSIDGKYMPVLYVLKDFYDKLTIPPKESYQECRTLMENIRVKYKVGRRKN